MIREIATTSAPRLSQSTCHMTTHRAISTTSTTATTMKSAAPWRSLFVDHIQGMKSPHFTLSTIRRAPAAAGGDGFSYMPRARTCIFRGMWASLPVTDKNDAPLNPDVYESDLPVFTTDVRMDKMCDLWGASAADSPEAWKGSGGGGPVEAMWWAEGPMVQWRVRGRAYVLGPDVDESECGREVQSVLESRMRRRPKENKDDEVEKGWSFAREVTAHFGNLSLTMRGTFRNPPPGTSVEVPVGDDGLGLGQKVTDLHDEIARRNFRVVVIVPYEVDRVDLSDPERGRRWAYTWASENRDAPGMPGGKLENGWIKAEVWP